jgi:D-amino-acid dehydrogenase
MNGTENVTIVGGGIVGLCCALQLQRNGLSVTVIDPGDPERACSFGNAGQLAIGEVVPLALPGVIFSAIRWLRDPLGPLAIRWRYLPQLMPWLVRLVLAGRRSQVERISRTMASLCDLIYTDYKPLLSAAGVEDLIVREGYIRLYENIEQWHAEGFGWQLRERAGLRYQLLEAATLRKEEPEVNSRFGFGVALTDRHFVANPPRLMRAFAEQILRNGGRMQKGEVIGFESSDDRVIQLRLGDGTRIVTTRVVIAAGAWSHRLSSLLGDHVPLESERGYHVMLPDPGIQLRRALSVPARGLVVVPMETGLRLCGTVELAGLDAPPDYRHAERLIATAKNLLPRLNTEGGKPWMGHRPSLPDSLPIIDRASRHANVWYAFGHGHMGLSWAATTGRLIADLLIGRPPGLDLKPFNLSRFRIEGSEQRQTKFAALPVRSVLS